MSEHGSDHASDRQVRGKSLLSILLLGGALALAGAGVAEAFRAVRSHQETAESLLRDYGAFAAWTYRERADEALTSAVAGTLGPLHRAGPDCDLNGLYRSVTGQAAQCGCSPSVLGDFVFRFRLHGDPAAIRFGGRRPTGVGAPETIRRTAVAGIRSMEPGWNFAMAETDPERGGGHRLVVRARPVDGEADDTLVYGFQVDEAKVRTLLEKAYLDSDLLPPTVTPDSASSRIVSVALLDDRGEGLFVSGDDGPDPEYAVADALHPSFGGWVARASVVPEAADGLIIGGLPRSRLPYLLGLFVLAGALAVGAVRQLRKQQELARLRSDFVASVSHELRTPLAQMRLFAETLRLGRTRSQEERAWFLESIESETLRLGHLVENVLQFSRAERGNGAGDDRPVDLGEHVPGVKEAFERVCASGGERDPRIVLRLEEGLRVRANPDSLRQILLNFLDNAVKYGPRDQVVLVVGRRVGDRVRIEVEDEGPGVPPSERETIWEPFRRGEDAVGTVAVGSGIGLAVSRELAERHGGRTWVEDGTDGGARFVLELPPAEASSDGPRPASDPGDGPAAPGPAGEAVAAIPAESGEAAD